MRIPDPEIPLPAKNDSGEAVLAGGCFWCTEAVFQALAGVTEVDPGYAGGSATTASYKIVCSGSTDHAEAIRIRYRPELIGYARLLQIFFAVAHDPTQVNRQGADVGRQYRSTIFYADPHQQQVARAYIDQLDRAGAFSAPLATTLEPSPGFYPAEDAHQNFVANNPAQPYVCLVAQPKLDKLRREFPDRLA